MTAVTGRAAARAQLDAGEAAIAAGALDAGLECLRRAAAESHASGDLELKARSLLALGGALAHAARGRDEEASAALHEAIAIARRLDRDDLVARAQRELAWVDLLRARFARAVARAEEARAADGGSPFDRALEGAAAYQQGRYRDGIEAFEAALEGLGDDPRLTAMGIGEIGLVRFMLGERDAARSTFAETLDKARTLAWNAYLPYPEPMLGIVEVRDGGLPAARERLEHAFALGCQIRDCCWEGIAAAGLALLDEAEANPDAAVERFEDAARRSVREPDSWLWAHAFVLDLACAFGVRHGVERTGAWVANLEALSSRTGMREFLARAYLYRFDLGDVEALAAAELVAADVDNPVLHDRLAERSRVRAT